ERDQAHLTIDVHRAAAPVERQKSARHGEWHRQHNNERIDEALELRRKHEIDEGQREKKREIDIPRSMPELAGRADVVDTCAGRQNAARGRLECVERLAL